MTVPSALLVDENSALTSTDGPSTRLPDANPNLRNDVTDPVHPIPGLVTIDSNGSTCTGSQTTISATGFGQPHYSRDSIAEFEFVANRFDATQGRSAGVQVNVHAVSTPAMVAAIDAGVRPPVFDAAACSNAVR